MLNFILKTLRAFSCVKVMPCRYLVDECSILLHPHLWDVTHVSVRVCCP